MPTGDLLIIGKIYLVSLIIQLIGWPVTKKIFSQMTDHGWPISRLLTSLLASLVIWELANLGFSVNTNMGLGVVMGGIAVISLVLILQGGRVKISREGLKMVVIEEYLFIVGLFGIAIVRSYLPNIDSLEKYMDFGFINRYLNSPTLPAMDMWQAGNSINYYSFGHFWASEWMRAFLVVPTMGYNLMLALVAGLSLSLAFSISHYLAGAKKGLAGMIAGITGAMTTVLAGNSHLMWYLISHRGLKDYWYAEATRFIHNTIHEFPGYSFVVADLHGHVLGLPMVLMFLLIFFLWLEKSQTIWEVMMGIMFGMMMMTNTWDVAVYGLLLVVVGLIKTWKDPKEVFGLVKAATVMGVVMVITAAPWLRTFESISSGIKMVVERTPWWQLAVLWTGGIVMVLMVAMLEKKGERKLPIRAMALTVILLILIPEIVYAKDIYPDHPRANTMFKLTYQASIMIGLLSGALWGKLLDWGRKINPITRSLGIVLASVILIGTMAFTAVSFPNFYRSFGSYQGLDGGKWLQEKVPEYAGVIDYLNEFKDGRNLVEAVGDSYTEFNAVSVFTAIPTVQGWRVHEWLWRGGYETVAIREAEVRSIYETVDNEERKNLLKRYNVGWIVVGANEKGMYNINEKAIKSLGEVVYEKNGTYLVRAF